MNRKVIAILAGIFLSGCANKFFPDKKLYQYPERTNDMAVVYPDGTIHHSDGSISAGRVTNSNTAENTGTDDSTSVVMPSMPSQNAGISARKDSTGRHARYRFGEQ